MFGKKKTNYQDEFKKLVAFLIKKNQEALQQSKKDKEYRHDSTVMSLA